MVILPVAITIAIAAVVLLAVVQVLSRVMAIRTRKAYLAGVAEALVWPHGDPTAPETIKTEVDESTARYFAMILNDAFQRDPYAMSILFEYKVPTNKDMIGHATIPVAGASDDQVTLSAVGIVNGLLPITRTRYRVAAVYDDHNPLIMCGFKAYDMEKGQFLEDLDAPARAYLPRSP